MRPVTGATADIPLDFSLALTDSNLTLDFLNTGSVKIGAAPGVSFTSDSGVFLTAAAGGVPEPTTWALLIGGFTVLGAVTRRRRSAMLA